MRLKLLLFVILLTSICHAGEFADELVSSDKSLSQIKQLIETEKNDIKLLKDEKKRAAKELNKAEMELRYHKKLSKKLNNKLSDIQREISLKNFKISTLSTRQEKLYNDIKSANLYLSGTGETELFEALILGDELNEVTAGMQIISKVNERLYTMTQEIANNRELINAAIKDLDQKQIDMKNAIAEKDQVIKEYASKKTLVKQLYKIAQEDERIKNEYIMMLQEQESTLEKKIKELHIMQQNAELTAKFDGLDKSFSFMKKKLSWPISGKIIEKFGKKKIKGFKGVVNKSGIKISPTEKHVASVYDGIVIHTDSAWGLGWFAIVEHAGGYYTLYANMDELETKVNQKVHKGEILGTIDVDHEANTPYLYFEIRIHDKAVDPLQWLSS